MHGPPVSSVSVTCQQDGLLTLFRLTVSQEDSYASNSCPGGRGAL